MDTKKLIRNLIENSNLGLSDKINAELLLEKSFMSKENQETREIIDVLENLYKDLGNKDIFKDQDYLAPRYKDLILNVIKEYKLKVRKNDSLLNTEYFQPFDDYKPRTLGELLKNIGRKNKKGEIILSPEILDKKVKIGEDDGSGYSPKGFKDVFTGYEGDDGNIYLWV